MSSLITPGAAFESALASARAKKSNLVSNKFADRLLVEGRAELPRIWTGTIVAYPAPGAPFGDNIILFDNRSRLRYVLETRAIKGERGAALVLEPGAYEISGKRGERMFVPKTAPIILPGFPQESGWYNVDSETLLPVLGHGKIRYLWRFSSEAVVAAVREHGSGGWAKFDIFLNQKPSSKFGAVLQSDFRAIEASAVC